MQSKYFVTLKDTHTGDVHITCCDSDKGLSNLLLHLDKEVYLVVSIKVSNVIVECMHDFFKKEPGLETGKKENEK